MSVVSSLDFRSRCVGKLRNSLNRLAVGAGVFFFFFSNLFSATQVKRNYGRQTDLFDRRTMLVDSPNNVDTPRASSAS